MLSLPKLHQQYKKQHPQYHDPLARYSPEDRELEKIKRTALSPYLQQLEEQMIIFKDIITIFAVLYDVVVDEFGFSAEVWRMQPIYVPVYAEHLGGTKQLDHWMRVAPTPPPPRPHQLHALGLVFLARKTGRPIRGRQLHARRLLSRTKCPPKFSKSLDFILCSHSKNSTTPTTIPTPSILTHWFTTT
jgi:hypothetical protein